MSATETLDSDVQQRRVFWFAFVGILSIVVLFWAGIPVSFGFDPNDEKCLPDLHLSLMVHRRPSHIEDGDLVFWKPAGALSFVKQEFVMKQVAGVPGDHLQIHGGEVLVNGRVVEHGLALAKLYHATPEQFERDETIPPGKLFVVGHHPHSDDSRYWGYLDVTAVVGRAYRIY
jgi:conjugal transfer pilin signal peptidase TrbI